MHKMRTTGVMPTGIRKGTPLAKEIETRRELMIRKVLGNTEKLIDQQISVASLPVSPDGPDNDTVLKATNSLLDRTFGKAKESIDLSGDVKFSLRALSKMADDDDSQPVTEDDDDNDTLFIEPDKEVIDEDING